MACNDTMATRDTGPARGRRLGCGMAAAGPPSRDSHGVAGHSGAMHSTLAPGERLDTDPGWPHRLHFALLGAALLASGLLALAAPAMVAQAMPWPLPPLHARCLGAMQLALAGTWLRAATETDRAALRIPLTMSAVAGGVLLGGALPGRTALAEGPGLLPAGGLLTLAHAGVLLWRDRMLQAPAEQPHRGLLALAALALPLALLLWLAPSRAAPWWPWALPVGTALPYAALLAPWGAAALLLAHERRRATRRHCLQGLLALGLLVPAVSLLHLPAFHGAAAALGWCAAFVAVAAVAARALGQSWH